MATVELKFPRPHDLIEEPRKLLDFEKCLYCGTEIVLSGRVSRKFWDAAEWRLGRKVAHDCPERKAALAKYRALSEEDRRSNRELRP